MFWSYRISIYLIAYLLRSVCEWVDVWRRGDCGNSTKFHVLCIRACSHKYTHLLGNSLFMFTLTALPSIFLWSSWKWGKEEREEREGSAPPPLSSHAFLHAPTCPLALSLSSTRLHIYLLFHLVQPPSSYSSLSWHWLAGSPPSLWQVKSRAPTPLSWINNLIAAAAIRICELLHPILYLIYIIYFSFFSLSLYLCNL